MSERRRKSDATITSLITRVRTNSCNDALVVAEGIISIQEIPFQDSKPTSDDPVQSRGQDRHPTKSLLCSFRVHILVSNVKFAHGRKQIRIFYPHWVSISAR